LTDSCFTSSDQSSSAIFNSKYKMRTVSQLKM